MTALLRAELFKLRTTRALYGYLAVLIFLSGIAAATQASDAELFQLESGDYQRDLLSESVAAPLIALLLGMLAVTVEWRHGTITRTLLVTPRRANVLLAKELNGFFLGVALAVIGTAVAIAVAAPVLSSDSVSFVFDAALAGRIVEIVLASALWGALGAGVGAVVQNQTAALVGSIVYIILIETLLAALLDWVDLHRLGDFLPRHALDSLAGHEAGLSAGGGAAVGLAYVVGFALLGWLRVRREDIT